MIDFSEEKIKANCPHCDPNSFALIHKLQETNNFWVVADVHPLSEGHILIIPKQHLSCIGEYSKQLFKEFLVLYKKYLDALTRLYGQIATFEHGKIGQSIFHSHVHLLPFKGSELDIVPEGQIQPLNDLSLLSDIYKKAGRYLFFSIGPKLWSVDPSLGTTRFFRDRFAKALGVPERGNWKEMHVDQKLMMVAGKEIANLKNKLTTV